MFDAAVADEATPTTAEETTSPPTATRASERVTERRVRRSAERIVDHPCCSGPVSPLAPRDRSPGLGTGDRSRSRIDASLRPARGMHAHRAVAADLRQRVDAEMSRNPDVVGPNGRSNGPSVIATTGGRTG